MTFVKQLTLALVLIAFVSSLQLRGIGIHLKGKKLPGLTTIEKALNCAKGASIAQKVQMAEFILNNFTKGNFNAVNIISQGIQNLPTLVAAWDACNGNISALASSADGGSTDDSSS